GARRASVMPAAAQARAHASVTAKSSPDSSPLAAVAVCTSCPLPPVSQPARQIITTRIEAPSARTLDQPRPLAAVAVAVAEVPMPAMPAPGFAQSALPAGLRGFELRPTPITLSVV